MPGGRPLGSLNKTPKALTTQQIAARERTAIGEEAARLGISYAECKARMQANSDSTGDSPPGRRVSESDEPIGQIAETRRVTSQRSL